MVEHDAHAALRARLDDDFMYALFGLDEAERTRTPVRCEEIIRLRREMIVGQLREAWDAQTARAERLEYSLDIAARENISLIEACHDMQGEKEKRREAEAQVEALTATLDEAHQTISARHTFALEAIAKIETERDQLAAEIAGMQATLQHIMQVLGPTTPGCDGCSHEIGEALSALRDAGIEYRSRKAAAVPHPRGEQG